MPDAQEWLRQQTGKAVKIVTWQLQNRGDADDECLARLVVEALKGDGWRPTQARPAPDWLMQRGTSAARLSDEDRERLKAEMAAATERQAAAAKARARARMTGGGDYPPGSDGQELDFDDDGLAR